MALDVDDLRALVRDSNVVVFSDEELQAAIDATGDVSLLRAAGMAFTALAAEYAITGRSVATDDLRLDTKGRGADLLAVARSFFAEASAADDSEASGYFEIIPFGGRTSRTGSCRVEGSPYPCSHGYYCGRC